VRDEVAEELTDTHDTGETMPRLARLLRLVHLLREDKPMSVEDLAERLNVSRRTVFRDLTTIRQAGGIVTYDAGRGYQLKQLAFGPWARLEAKEALALSVLHRYLKARQDDPILAAALRPLAELLSSADDHVKEACKALGDAIEIVDPAPPVGLDRSLVLDALRAAESGHPVTVKAKSDKHARPATHRNLTSGRLERLNGEWHFTALPAEGQTRLRFRLADVSSIQTHPPDDRSVRGSSGSIAAPGVDRLAGEPRHRDPK